VITEGRMHGSQAACTLRFDPGTIVVFDRGYTDCACFGALNADDVNFASSLFQTSGQSSTSCLAGIIRDVI